MSREEARMQVLAVENSKKKVVKIWQLASEPDTRKLYFGYSLMNVFGPYKFYRPTNREDIQGEGNT